MSRSIHMTRAQAAVALGFSAKAAKNSAALMKFVKAHKDLRKKRRIKGSVVAERRKKKLPLDGTASEAIPISILDESDVIRHGASKEDVIAVLDRLPHAAREGIPRIQLCLGKAEQEDVACELCKPVVEVDPLLGRCGYAIVPGVYAGLILGQFSGRSGLIQLFAFVIDEASIRMPWAALKLYLRLHALTTLTHEIAHHHDAIQRVKRGRWLSDREASYEAYADKMQGKWQSEAVVPYLMEAHHEEVNAFLEWLEFRGGLKMSLDFFTQRGRMDVFEVWALELENASEEESRRRFQLLFSKATEQGLMD